MTLECGLEMCSLKADTVTCEVSVAPVASVPKGQEVAVSLPEVKDGVLYIDGATLEGLGLDDAGSVCV